MPGPSEHLAWARRHAEGAEAILQIGTAATRPWAVVALAYAAGHLAHALLAVEPGLQERWRHPENHTGSEPHPGTNTILRTRFIALWPLYQSLYSEGKAVRYAGRKVSLEAVTELRREFKELRAAIRVRLGEASPDLLRDDWP